MNKDHQKEEEFYANDAFCFSYSSLNKLLFSPSLFYKDYILKQREIQTDKHLIAGKLIHCLVFEPENLLKKFNLVPGKTPSDSVRKVLKNMSLHTDAKTLVEVEGRQNTSIQLFMVSKDGYFIQLNRCSDLLPWGFDGSFLEA